MDLPRFASLQSYQLSIPFCIFHPSFCDGYFLCAREISSILKQIIQSISWFHLSQHSISHFPLFQQKLIKPGRRYGSQTQRQTWWDSGLRPCISQKKEESALLAVLPAFSVLTCEMAVGELYREIFCGVTKPIPKGGLSLLIRVRTLQLRAISAPFHFLPSSSNQPLQAKGQKPNSPKFSSPVSSMQLHSSFLMNLPILRNGLPVSWASRYSL